MSRRLTCGHAAAGSHRQCGTCGRTRCLACPPRPACVARRCTRVRACRPRPQQPAPVLRPVDTVWPTTAALAVTGPAVAVAERPNALGPPRPVVCCRCQHTTADCTCWDKWLAGR